MHIELRQLRYFVAVAQELHFGRAAQSLHMTQPPLSQAIQGLEQVLGTALFTRSTRSIALTAAGIALLPEAQRLLQQAQLLPQLAQRAASGEVGQLSLSFISIADYSILPPALSQFRAQHQDVKILLREATSNVQLEMLEKNEIDAGLLIPPIPHHLQKHIAYQKISEEPLMLAIHESVANRLHGQPHYLSSYQDLPLILFPRVIAPALHDTILACFSDAQLTPVIAQEAIQMQTIIALVSANMGFALVPQSVSHLKRAGVVYKTLQEPTQNIREIREIKKTTKQSQHNSQQTEKQSSNHLKATVEIGIAWRRDNSSPVLRAFLQLFQ